MLLQFSSLITVHEKLHFKITVPITSLGDYTVLITEGHVVLVSIPETGKHCPKGNKHLMKLKKIFN